ncbi:MAG: hypothetical protein AAGB11_10005 [Pseudomonadota bacterium]
MPTYITHWKCEPQEWPTDRASLIRIWNEMLTEGDVDLQLGTVKFAGWVSNSEGYGIVEAASKADVIQLCAKFWPMVHNDIMEIVPSKEAGVAIVAGTEEGWDHTLE